jgi:hypothetical protein
MRRLAATLTVTFAGWTAVYGQTPAVSPPGSPAVTLGAPRVSASSAPVTASPPVIDRGLITRGQSADDGYSASRWTASLTEPNGDGVPAIAPLQIPTSTVTVSATASSTYPPNAPPFTDAPVPPSDPMLPPSRAAVNDRSSNHEHKAYFGDLFNGIGGGGPEGKCFESDHCFDYFASPVSNPFFAEDPRSLTEVRPIFLFQTIPNGNPLFKGGNTEFFGTQARVAITDEWSFVMNKLGGVSINPGGGSALPSETGFAEIWLGPKWTFLRNTETGTVLATGATFQIPAGSTRVSQDTGNLSIAPYISGAQNFGCTSYGSFNAMSTLGFSFATDKERTDYLFSSLHLDYDVGNRHFLYPLVELNWFYYTDNGRGLPASFEGQDLANFGSTSVSGRGNLSIATGVRYKFSECIQTGIALQFPLTHTSDFQSFRLGIDVIFRY